MANLKGSIGISTGVKGKIVVLEGKGSCVRRERTLCVKGNIPVSEGE